MVCQERIWNMRAYWEVEYSGWVVIGVTYEGAGRRANSGPSGLGENEESWGLCWSGSGYQFWFNGVNKDISDVPYCSTIGVYVDQPAGIMNFYAVTGKGAEREIQLLHKVRTTITKKILPGFWIGVQSSCTILRQSEWKPLVFINCSCSFLRNIFLFWSFVLFFSDAHLLRNIHVWFHSTVLYFDNFNVMWLNVCF